ncbi:DUF7159 family protein [Mycobacterium asiaticum]|uniref:DUF7159 family protein n=1 Tax=Mycobacterium asiaticum TaxID=1790 RepID=UPI0007EFCB7D|nr:hypothetical protein A5661_24345 [Mycobacterium asiaticum]
MDVVLGVSMAPRDVRIALVEGQDADGVIVDEDSFRLPGNAQPTSASDRVLEAILGTREGAADAGLRLSSIGVCWTDQMQAAALREALAARKVENVMLVSAFLASVAMAQAVGESIGYRRTGVLFIEPDSATLAVVNTADGSMCDVLRRTLDDDDDTAVAELTELVSRAETMNARPDGLYVVGSGVDVPMIKPALEAATSLTLNMPEEPEMALARGAALASGSAPLFASSTAALAYAQDPDDRAATDLAYSALPDEDDGDKAERRRPALLVGSGLAVVAIAAVVALEVALAINIRPTVALQPKPNENHLVAPAAPPPAPTQVAAPQHKIDIPGPAVPRAVPPQLAPAPAAPVAPAPELPAPRLPEPVAAPPVVPIVVPPLQIPGPDSLLRPPAIQIPRQQPQLPAPQLPVPATPPRVVNRVPQAPVIQAPNPGRGPFGGGRGPFGGGGPANRGPFGGDGGSPADRGPFGGGGGPGGGFGGGHGPFGGAPGGGFGGGHGPFGGGGGFGGGHGPFGGGGGFGGGHGPFGGGGGGFGGGGGRGHR